MAKDFSGSRIFIDNCSNNLVLKLGISGNAIELSGNKVQIKKDIEILGNINNIEYNNLKSSNIKNIQMNTLTYNKEYLFIFKYYLKI